MRRENRLDGRASHGCTCTVQLNDTTGRFRPGADVLSPALYLSRRVERGEVSRLNFPRTSPITLNSYSYECCNSLLGGSSSLASLFLRLVDLLAPCWYGRTTPDNGCARRRTAFSCRNCTPHNLVHCLVENPPSSNLSEMPFLRQACNSARIVFHASREMPELRSTILPC